MGDTKQLIEQLSAQVTPVRPLRLQRYAVLLLAAFSLYAVCTHCWLEGFRSDLSLQFQRPLFVTELLLLAAMLVSSVLAALYAMQPDGAQQKKHLMRLPYLPSFAMFALIIFQLFMPHDTHMVIQAETTNGHKCTMYIGLSSILPAMLIFWVLRKGASAMPMQAGALAVIAAVSVSAITLRLSEASDGIMHLLILHYLPTIFFAGVGALLGRFLLRW